MEARRVPLLPLFAIIGLSGAMIGLFIDDRDWQMLALLGVLFISAIVKNWIEDRWAAGSQR